MNTKYNGVTKEYKARFRSLMFNLQDQKARRPLASPLAPWLGPPPCSEARDAVRAPPRRTPSSGSRW